jgi:SNF2 family DNA or RNA helicase
MLDIKMQNIQTNQLERWFGSKTLKAGISYAKSNKVISHQVQPTSEGLIIQANVQGSRSKPYKVKVEIEGTGDYITSLCTCPVAHNCKHGLAAIIVANLPFFIKNKIRQLNLHEKPNQNLIYWLNSLPEKTLAQDKEEPAIQGEIVFILNYAQYGHKPYLSICPHLIRLLKKGGYSKPKPFYPSTSTRKNQITTEELEWFGLLDMFAEKHYIYDTTYSLSCQTGIKVLKRLLATSRCYWQNVNKAPIQEGAPIKATMVWEVQDDGTQKLKCQLPSHSQLLLPLQPPWYLDLDSCCAGPIELDLPESYQPALFDLPPIPVTQAQNFVKELQKRLNNQIKLPLPKVFTAVQNQLVEPKPYLYIHIKPIYCSYPISRHRYEYTNKRIILADLTFLYENIKVEPVDKQQIFTQVKGDTILQYNRDQSKEQQYLQDLEQHKIIPLTRLGTVDIYRLERSTIGAYYIAEADDLGDLYDFKNLIAPELIKSGWRIDYAPECLELAPIEVDAWYTELDEKSEYDWFGLELGVIVKNERINLLPHLIQALQKSDLTTSKDNKILLKLPKVGLLPIPAERIQRIMDVITQLVDPGKLEQNQEVKLSRYHAALLLEMEKAFQATEMRSFGNKKLWELGRALEDFKGLKEAQVPKDFNAELRPYQAYGISWLQFLREFHLNGILADDMGLGKTVQTLAHLSIEKAAGRMTTPCLIIAPTSVVHNWQREIQRFSPYLKTIVLQGADRKEKFDEIKQADIVLTTYPLLSRDKDYLLNQDYYQVILDEAQYIKNSQAKMTQIIQQLKAKHRLCLTGTPLENHLGELWSLFHFLMPGLLGNKQQFSSRYRNPIEKHQDENCQMRLSKLIKPFVLRRTKQEVLLDLPPKTEIVRTIDLDKQQRGLYESIRLAMHKKVRQAIDQKGIERSHIIILDALLKLRQVCCDPRLLKMETAKNIKESAKLDTLMKMLTDMCKEGRRILVFSQFTKMLALIEEELQKKHIEYVVLMGSTKDRNTPIKAFQEGNIPIFLISLKAGGTGLNLTAADTVIHYDPWWNPAVEQQAADRAYRIGQDKPVFVYKLVVASTVEEKMLEMQEKKKSYMDAIFSGGEHKGKITKQDLDILFARE